MPRPEDRRYRRPAQDREGCFRILDFLLLDILFNTLMDVGCSGCLGCFGLILTTCLALVFVTHGLAHLAQHRPMALAFHPVRAACRG